MRRLMLLLGAAAILAPPALASAQPYGDGGDGGYDDSYDNGYSARQDQDDERYVTHQNQPDADRYRDEGGDPNSDDYYDRGYDSGGYRNPSDNGYGANGYGSNGYGSNGYGTNGYGTNGYGDRGNGDGRYRQGGDGYYGSQTPSYDRDRNDDSDGANSDVGAAYGDHGPRLRFGEHYTGRNGGHWTNDVGQTCVWRELARDAGPNGRAAYRWVADCGD